MNLSRRDVIAGAAGLVAASPQALAQAPAGAHAFGFDRPGGGQLSLADYRGRPILVVNTATRYSNETRKIDDVSFNFVWDATENVVRWVTAFDTTPEHVDTFIADIRLAVREAAGA